MNEVKSKGDETADGRRWTPMNPSGSSFEPFGFVIPGLTRNPVNQARDRK
jgi:hypothetical protein